MKISETQIFTVYKATQDVTILGKTDPFLPHDYVVFKDSIFLLNDEILIKYNNQLNKLEMFPTKDIDLLDLLNPFNLLTGSHSFKLIPIKLSVEEFNQIQLVLDSDSSIGLPSVIDIEELTSIVNEIKIEKTDLTNAFKERILKDIEKMKENLEASRDRQFHKVDKIFTPQVNPNASTPVGIRYNSNKPMLSLIPPLGLKEVGKVSTFGAEKYAKWNWANGLPITEIMDSAYRHLNAFLTGEDLDPETKLSHAAHAAWNCMAIVDMMQLHPEKDDRPKIYNK